MHPTFTSLTTTAGRFSRSLSSADRNYCAPVVRIVLVANALLLFLLLPSELAPGQSLIWMEANLSSGISLTPVKEPIVTKPSGFPEIEFFVEHTAFALASLASQGTPAMFAAELNSVDVKKWAVTVSGPGSYRAAEVAVAVDAADRISITGKSSNQACFGCTVLASQG